MSGDLNTSALSLDNFGRNNQSELGQIDDIIQAAGSLTSLLINVLKKPPADTWSVWNMAQKKKYVTEILQVATTDVILGKAISATNIFRELISKVDPNYNWAKWQKKNPVFVLAYMQANDELKQYLATGYSRYMLYVNPKMIYKVQHPASSAKPATASILGGNSIMIVLAIGATALLIKVLASKPESEILYVSAQPEAKKQ